MNETNNQRPDAPKRRPQQSPAGSRPAGSGQRPAGQRPAGQRPAGQRPAGQRPAGQRPANRRPAAQRPAAATVRAPRQSTEKRQVHRNYTRLYIFLGVLGAVALLVIGILLLKGGSSEDSGTSNASSAAETTTTTTEPIVTEPPIVQEITFNTPLLYSVTAGAEIAEYNGDPKMKVQGSEAGLPSEITWNLAELVGANKVSEIRTVSMDITCVSSAVIGQCNCGLRTRIPQTDAQTGEITGNSAMKLTDILLIDREHTENTWHIESKIPAGTLGGSVTTLNFVRYSDDVQTDVYLDNLRFLDGYGNPIDVIYNADGAQTGAHTAAPTETTTTATELPAAQP